MSELLFKAFREKTQSEKKFIETPDTQVLDFYKEKISADFAAFMAEEGYCSYFNGLLTSINPIEYREKLKKSEIDLSENVPIFKNSFGDILLLNNKDTTLFFSSYNEDIMLGQSGDEMEPALPYIFNNFIALGENNFYEIFCDQELFGEASQALGLLQPNESYGFITPLVEEGEKTAANMHIVDTLEYLDSLSQLF